MPIEKKKIDIETASSHLGEMYEASGVDKTVSLGNFVARNLDSLNALLRSGKSVKQIYEYLKVRGQDVGTYHGFRSTCYRAGLRRRIVKNSKAAKGAVKSIKPQSPERPEIPHGSQSDRNAVGLGNCKAKTSKYNPALPPIILPGGIEANIDLETGAKFFEIQPGKE